VNLKRPNFKAPSLKGGDHKLPPAVENVYGDLRDRKLLPIVALLVVAIIAVPVVLSSGSTPTVTRAPSAEIVPADAPEAQAAVLAENPGLRNYEQRLAELKSKNPFDQQYPVTAAGGGSSSAGTETTSTASGGSVTDTSASSGSTDPTGGSSGGSGTAADAVTDDASVTIDETAEPVESGFYEFRADVRFGPEGDVKERKNVRVLDILDPVGAFIGGISGHKRKAVFAMSNDIAAASGEGECAPSPGNCDFLLLKEGQTADLTYQPPDASAAQVFTLGVDDVRLVRIKEPDLDEGKLAD
jgi:hypothetical protein